MMRKLLTMLLAGTLTLQGVTPVLAEEISAETFVSETVVAETETTEGSEESYAPETESVSIETETSSEMESAAASEAITEVDVSETELIEEEIIIGSEQGAVEAAVDLDAWEAGLETASVAGDVAINESNFPDAKFRNYVVTKFDKNTDGVLNAWEVEHAESIDMTQTGVSTLKGIEFFTGLQILNCGYNKLTSLDVSNSPDLWYLFCDGNQLTELDVSKNVKLKTLACMNNKIKNLDLTKNVSLERIQCGLNLLTNLDVSKNTNLQELSCGGNQIAKLDMSKNTQLINLACGANCITDINLTKNVSLESLSCGQNPLKELDLSANVNLKGLAVEKSGLQELDLSKNINLESLVTLGSQLVCLNLKHIPSVVTSGEYGEREISAVRKGNVWEIDIASLVGRQNIENVNFDKLTSDIKYVNGVLEISGDGLPRKITYQYDTGLPKEHPGRYFHVTLWMKTCAAHKFGEYVTTKQPTYTTEGLAVRTCSVCGYQETKTLPKLAQKATVSFSTDSLTLQVGKSVSLKNYVTGMQKGDSISRWNSFAVNIASVDANGNVTAKRAGKAYIAVGTKEGAVAKILITVQDTAVHTTGISGLHTGIALEVGKTVTLRPVITPANSQDPVQYASVAPNIVTVSANGVVKGIRAGSAYVYVKSGTKYVKILVKVTAGSLTAITGVRTTGSLYVGASYQLRPQRYPAGSAGVFYYKSTDPSVAVVDKNGKIIAKKKGITVITVTARNVSTTMRLTVK